MQLLYKQIRFVVGVSNIKLSKINRMNRQKKKKDIVDRKSTINQFNMIKIYFHTTAGYKFPLEFP